jgi:glutamate/tyrosine decarboxylase-like PLP-dependent enzyme
MDLAALGRRLLARLDPRLLAAAERALKELPPVRRRIERESAAALAGLERALKPYRGRRPALVRLPAEGLGRDGVLAEVEALAAEERGRWEEGFASGAVYHGDPDHVAFLNRVYGLVSQANPLHPDLWPSIARMEAEVVAMTASLLGAPEEADPARRVRGSITSGGTESIVLAMKAYRDRARAGGIDRPEIVAPSTAHPAFEKAAHWLGMRLVRVPVGDGRVADVAATRRAIGRRTAVVVGSAPCFPYGLVDPVAELSELARRRGIGFHADACLGGFLLPFARRLGYPVPDFDFRLPGVTSISADTHKFGYAAKGTSVVLYRGRDLHRFQYEVSTDWEGGLYASPTLAGSRPGALSATAWAAMVSIGEKGYLEAARHVLEAAAAVKRGVAAIGGLRVVGDPLFVVAFASDELDVYRVLDAMTARRWSLNALQRPPAVHLCLTLRHAQPGVVERFLRDLAESVAQVRRSPAAEGGMAPVYGMAGALPFRGVVGDLLGGYLDVLSEP